VTEKRSQEASSSRARRPLTRSGPAKFFTWAEMSIHSESRSAPWEVAIEGD
jgi:hypothetical protein